MSADDKYFTFPLYALAQTDLFRTCEHVSFLGLGHICQNIEAPRSIKKAAKSLNVVLNSKAIKYTLWIKQAQELPNMLAAKFGVSPLVRLRTDIVLNTRNKTGNYALREREFRVLCALYSYIGDKPFCQVALSKIQERAAGCKTRAMLNALPEGQRGPVYTPKMIRTAIDRLHGEGQGYFARVTYRNHKTYYSHRKTEAELIELVAQKAAARKARQSASDSLEKRIAEIEAGRAGSGQVPDNINKEEEKPW
jgi:hypothetical protein